MACFWVNFTFYFLPLPLIVTLSYPRSKKHAKEMLSEKEAKFNAFYTSTLTLVVDELSASRSGLFITVESALLPIS